MVDTTIAGSYQFIGNRLVLDPDAPPLESVNGRLDFTESGIRVNGATAQVFGGPAAINVASQRDGTVRVGVSGRATAELLRRELPQALGQALRGSTDWRATVSYRRKVGSLVVESSLAGLAIDLPPPFGKAMTDTLPLRIERHTENALAVAKQAGLAGRINTVTQACFFAISGILPREEAIAEIKEAIQDYENDLKRSLTKIEKEYVRLSYTDPDAGSEFYQKNGLDI
jgi:uncharacterized protein YhdP